MIVFRWAMLIVYVLWDVITAPYEEENNKP
jgi:hypothetical protein